MALIFKIIIILFLVIIGVVILLFFASFFGGMFFLGNFIKRATEKKTPEFLANEKVAMKNRVNALIPKLKDWKSYSVNDITNSLAYSYSRQITSKLFGTIKGNDGEEIIAFLRHQRGNYIDCRMYAAATAFNYFFEMKNDLTLIERNGIYFGKIVNERDLYDSADLKLADIIKNQDGMTCQVNFLNGISITINRSFDNKHFVNNPFYRSPHTASRIGRQQKVFRAGYEPYPMIFDAVPNDENVINWATVLVLRETIFNSFSFVS